MDISRSLATHFVIIMTTDPSENTFSALGIEVTSFAEQAERLDLSATNRI